MYQLTALYSHPEDPAAFDKHYREVHAVLGDRAARPTQGVHDELARARPGRRHADVPPHRHALLGHRGALQAAFATPAGEAAMADLPNFAGAGVDILSGPAEVVI